MITIYALLEWDGTVRYVGKTSKSPYQRLKNHLTEAKGDRTTKSHRLNWLRQFTDKRSFPILLPLEYLDDADEACKRERFWIRLGTDYLGWRLVNGSDGGDGGRISPDAIERMRLNLLGRKLSPEHRAKCGTAMKGKKHADDTRRKMSAIAKGKKKSAEHCKNIGIAHRRESLSAESLQKRSDNIRKALAIRKLARALLGAE